MISPVSDPVHFPMCRKHLEAQDAHVAVPVPHPGLMASPLFYCCPGSYLCQEVWHTSSESPYYKRYSRKSQMWPESQGTTISQFFFFRGNS